MVHIQEESFPRGGRKVNFQKSAKKRKNKDKLFDGGPKMKKTTKSRTVANEIIGDAAWHSQLKLKGTLSYEKMQDGLVVLCCVKHISNLKLQVEFPGLTFGTIVINQISDAFTEALTAQLNDNDMEDTLNLKNLFHVGQILPTKIVSVTKNEKGYDVQATTNPSDINASKNSSMFKKGLTVWANVISQLDHGYELSLGVKNCRLFLPMKNVADHKEKYELGEPLFCVIHKVETQDFVTTLTVSAKQKHLEKIQIEDAVLDGIVPGMKVQFTVDEIIPNGIKGTFFESCYAYIDKSQISSKTNLKKLHSGTTLQAYILFTEPMTKVTYLTLHSAQNLQNPTIELGTIMSAKILSIEPKGLNLELSDDNIGLVTNNRLLKTLPQDAQLDIGEAVRKKYQVGTKHQCRILDFNYLEQLYICTLEKQVIKEKVYKAKDLKIGQNVTVRIQKINFKGFVVKCGNVQGFIPNNHISNAKFTKTVTSKFSPGMEVEAKVFNVTDENVIFTLKPGLLELNVTTIDPEDVVIHSKHVGVVVDTMSFGALVSFFGDVKGWISAETLNRDSPNCTINPKEYFFVGQVISGYILEKKHGRIQLSLNGPKVEKKMKGLKVGHNCTGIITEVKADGVDVKVEKWNVVANVPLAHLSDNLQIGLNLLKFYAPGQKLSNLLCVKSDSNLPILSRREYLAKTKKLFKFHNLKDLKKGMILRCSIHRKDDSGIYVTAPIKDHQEPILISNVERKVAKSLQKHQRILTKISKVHENTVKLTFLRAKADEKSILKDLTDTLEEYSYIRDLYDSEVSKLTHYKIGARVKCKVKNITDEGNYIVKLSNGVTGIVPKHLTDKASQGKEVSGTVLEYNFLDNCIYISCKNKINKLINSLQDGTIQKDFNTSVMAKCLLVTDLYVIGVLIDKQCNQQLVYLPCQKELSDLYGKKMKVMVCKQSANKIVGLPKGMVKKLKKEPKSLKLSPPKEEVLEICDDHITDDENDDAEDPTTDVTSTVEFKEEEEEENSTNVKSILSGAKSFYMTDDVNNDKDSSESEDDDDNQSPKKKHDKRKKNEPLTNQILDSATIPQSAEQFDRLLLANPNSSELWLQYISMHIAATELDKARSVAKRAIETIKMTLVEEKFNIWIALLNLENLYGSKESFENTFSEAVKYNDNLEVYLSVIKILSKSGKITEMEEKIKKIQSKEKQSVKMWLEIGRVYYSLNKFREARNIKETSLKSIIDKQKQFDLILRFAIMEFQLGELDQAVNNFETILETYPKKINIWIIYVDQLVKCKKIEEARKVLDRAVKQKLNVKSMKCLFQKFVSFEEQNGNAESVTDVKKKAAEYVDSIVS